MNDPLVRVDDLADALGLPAFQLRLWLRAADIQRPAKGMVPMFAALSGVLAAVRAETAEARSFRALPIDRGAL